MLQVAGLTLVVLQLEVPLMMVDNEYVLDQMWNLEKVFTFVKNSRYFNFTIGPNSNSKTYRFDLRSTKY